MTDILAPVQQAFDLLSQQAASKGGDTAVPFVFLMTVLVGWCLVLLLLLVVVV